MKNSIANLNQTALISIVIPVYNASKYLNECIDSILAQTYQNFEIILVDDGSTDNSVEIIKSYNDKRICLIRNTHDYIHSLNLGMNTARGKYIARMDSDDIMMPNRLELQYKFMEEHPEVDVCGGFARAFGATEYDIKVTTSEKDIILNLIFGNPMIHPTTFMKRSLVNLFPQRDEIFECYDPEYIYAEDYNLWVDIVIKGHKLANIADLVLNYRIGEHQVTNNKRVEMVKCSYRISMKYMEHILQTIAGANDSYTHLFDNLIELYNNENITFEMLRQINSIFYKHYILQKKCFQK